MHLVHKVTLFPKKTIGVLLDAFTPASGQTFKVELAVDGN